jgi:branched-chain amino acid transport system ATP-binding protein
MLLRVEGLQVRYGKVPAIHELSLDVAAGEIVCLVGPNGAGKSTFMHAVMGLVGAATGTVEFDGKPLRGLPPEAIARAGVNLVPEGRRVFGRLTVRENLSVASGMAGGAQAVRPRLERVMALFPILRERFNGYAGQLSGGEQQQLAIARALICAPRLLLVDEPSLGLAPRFADLVFETLGRLREEGTTLLIVEQSAKRALKLADRTYLLRSGRIVLAGRSSDLAGSAEFEHAYFGGTRHT